MPDTTAAGKVVFATGRAHVNMQVATYTKVGYPPILPALLEQPTAISTQHIHKLTVWCSKAWRMVTSGTISCAAGGWQQDKRHGFGRCRFADGMRFAGRWEADGWVQSAADAARSSIAAECLPLRATAGCDCCFSIQVRACSLTCTMSGMYKDQALVWDDSRHVRCCVLHQDVRVAVMS